MRTELLARLIQPPKHSRATSASLVLSLCVVIAATYVAARGSFGNLALNLLPLVLAVSWLGLGWGITVAFVVNLLRAAGDLTNAWIDPTYFFADADLFRIISNRLGSFMTFACIAAIINELILLSRELEERVQVRTTALRQASEVRERLQDRLFEAGMRERAAIGHDLHDGLGQHLTATAMAANILTTRLREREDPLTEDAVGVETLIRDSITQTRQIARGLLLESVPAGQLEYELEELVAMATENFRIACKLTTVGSLTCLDTPTSSHLFYIAREALRNSLRHAEATRVDVHLAVQPDRAELTVVDDGVGLAGPSGDTATEAEGVGLQIMIQRAEFIGGTLRFHSPAPSGLGTQLECCVPLSTQAA